MTFTYVIAWLTPLLVGSGIVALRAGRPRSFGERAATLGCGFVLGMLLCGLAMSALCFGMACITLVKLRPDAARVA